jgi:hypothetical protein
LVRADRPRRWGRRELQIPSEPDPRAVVSKLALMQCSRAKARVSLGGDCRAVRTDQRYNAGIREASLAHLADAIGTCEIEAAPGLNEHVEAHQQPREVDLPFVVDQHLTDDQ